MVDIRYEVLDYGRDKLSDPVFFIVRNPVAPVPTIESLSPSSGEAGSTISITGSGFGASKEAVQVLFAGSTGATISSISNTSIVVKVPDFLTAGTYPVTVKLAYAVNGQVNYATSNAVNYLVKAPVIVVPQPAITNLTPASGEAGSTISITGSGFGTSKEAVQVLFAGNTGSTVLSVTNTSIVLKVPDFLTAGTYPVTVKLAYAANGQVNYATSNAVNYLVKAPVIVVPQPAITSLTPASGEAGSTISITGSGFGASKEVVQVLFADSTGATVLSVANTSILVRVPDFLTPGTYPVSVKMAYAASGQINYVTSNAMNYKVVLAPVTPEVFVTPVISSLSVPSGEAGTVLIIYGNDFGSSQGLSELLFGQQAANVIAWEKGQIVVIVPALTKGAYPVMVKRKNSQGEVLISNAVNYSINSGSEIIVEEITDPILDLITPSRVLPGTIVRLAGENFGSEQGLSYVTIAGVPVETRMWSDTIIFVQVPSYLTRGTYTIKVEKKKATTSQLLAKSSNGADLVITAASTQLVPYPNPFSPALGNSINIEVTSAGVAQAELAIYDLSGRKIWGKFWSLVAGVNTTAWNGRDYASQLVGDGIYLVRVSSGSQTIAKGKILVVK
jgi:hypothetical protein